MNGATIMNVNNGGRAPAAVPENSTVGPSEPTLELKNNFTPSAGWTRDKQSLLEELLAKYASDSTELRLAKISKILRVKARDVALRCSLMNKKDKGKQKKDDNGSSRRKKKDKLNEKVAEQRESSSHASNHADSVSYAQSSVSTGNDDAISYKAFGGSLGQLLEQNAQALHQISANISDSKIHENINLFAQTRNNILTILNNLNDIPGVINQLPPLPVKLNDKLARSVLP